MPIRQWIIPEPDPRLRISIKDIDIRKLNYEDIQWIYSSRMKKYTEEFMQIHGFLHRAKFLSAEYKQPNKELLIPLPTKELLLPLPNKYSKTPHIFPKDPETFIEINTKKSLPFNKIPFLKRFHKKNEFYI